MLLLGGCGGLAPAPRVEALAAAEEPGFGPLRWAAWQVVLDPAALADGLRALDARLGEAGDALGPVGVAWRKAREALGDLLADAAPRGGTARDALSGWGLHPETRLGFSVGATTGSQAGRHLLAVAAGLSEASVTHPLWHARLRARLQDAAAVEEALFALAGRTGWSTLDPRALPPAFGGPAPAAVFWLAHAPADGLVLVARRRTDALVLDLLVGTGDLEPSTVWPSLGDEHPLAERAPLPAVGGGAGVAGPEGGGAGPAGPKGGGGAFETSVARAPAQLWLDPAGLAAFEVALDVARALAPYPGATAAMRQSLAEAGAALTASCVERWQRTADLAVGVHVAVDPGAAARGGREAEGAAEAGAAGEPALAVTVHLTPAGAEAWTAAARPRPLVHLGAWPAAWQAGLSGAAFPGSGAGTPGWAAWAEGRGCGAGDLGSLLLGGLVHLPTVLDLRILPRPEPPLGDVDQLTAVEGAAGALLDVQGGADGLHLGLASVLVGAGTAAASPLGPDAVPEPGGGVVLQAPGAQPVVWRRRTAGEGAPVTLVLGLGAGVADRVEARLADRVEAPLAATSTAAGDAATLLEARVDPRALLATLVAAGEAGPSVAALRALATRLGAWHLRVDRVGSEVRLRLGPEASLSPVPEPSQSRGAEPGSISAPHLLDRPVRAK